VGLTEGVGLGAAVLAVRSIAGDRIDATGGAISGVRFG
jgi:hypothetical protein